MTENTYADATMRCACGAVYPARDVIGIEYEYGSPERYDGVSEWLYPDGHHVGRWTGRLLAEGEDEPRFGGAR